MIGIIGAMPEEIKLLAQTLQNEEVEPVAGRDYHKGTLCGQQVVLAYSHIGKVSAAATATAMIERYEVEELIFTGVAGGIASKAKVGDFVIGTQSVQHDMDCSPLPAFERFEIPLLGVSHFPMGDVQTSNANKAIKNYLKYQMKEDISQEVLEEFGITAPGIHEGLIGSGDQFIASSEKVKELRNDLPGIMCIEMEGAAVAQICYEYKTPFSLLRVISDNADDSATHDFLKFVSDVASHFTAGVVKELLALKKEV